MLIKNFASNKIILGTVNFGIKYGVEKSQVKMVKVNAIINSAIRNKINFFDTAQSYGQSETLLGHIKNKIMIITKINPDKSWSNFDLFSSNIQKTLKKLNKKKIDTILFHDTKIFKTEHGKLIFSHLNYFKKKKIIKNIGFSIYEFSDLDFLLKKYKFDIIQCPFNILDRRLVDDGYLKILKKNNIKVHVRSVFLQGVLVNQSLSSHPYFIRWKKKLDKWFEYLQIKKIHPVEACLSYVLSSGIDKIILGISNPNELGEILESRYIKKIKLLKIFTIRDKKLINPSVWNI